MKKQEEEQGERSGGRECREENIMEEMHRNDNKKGECLRQK
jgi:hypothetical protein